MKNEGLIDLLYRIADDDLIMGHRNSEWTGIGPVLEEDIAFSSMAQDQIGHAFSYYTLLNELGEKDPDTIGFLREEKEYKCCHLVEYPIEDYAFSLVRHFLYDKAKQIRLLSLMKSSYAPLAELANRIYREQKYHTMHAYSWVTQLGNGSDESIKRMQEALNRTYPLALGLFESTKYEDEIVNEEIQQSESVLCELWQNSILNEIDHSQIKLPEISEPKVHWGGRSGLHTEYLQPLLDEMTEVIKINPTVAW